jgi:hypothetical protein
VLFSCKLIWDKMQVSCQGENACMKMVRPIPTIENLYEKELPRGSSFGSALNNFLILLEIGKARTILK